MSFAYVAQMYGRRFKRGQRVVAGGKPGAVTSATHHVWVRLDGQKHPVPFHPTDVEAVP